MANIPPISGSPTPPEQPHMDKKEFRKMMDYLEFLSFFQSLNQTSGGGSDDSDLQGKVQSISKRVQSGQITLQQAAMEIKAAVDAYIKAEQRSKVLTPDAFSSGSQESLLTQAHTLKEWISVHSPDQKDVMDHLAHTIQDVENGSYDPTQTQEALLSIMHQLHMPGS